MKEQIVNTARRHLVGLVAGLILGLWIGYNAGGCVAEWRLGDVPAKLEICECVEDL